MPPTLLYASIADVQSILPDNIVIGTNALEDNVSILETDVTSFIEFATEIINSNLRNIYRVPLMRVKSIDFTTAPTSSSDFNSDFPSPIRLLCTRLAAGHLYDELINANQEPNIVDWGKNQRALAYDQLRNIQSGAITLKGQEYTGHRFIRKELLDDPRLSRPGEFPTHQRSAGT